MGDFLYYPAAGMGDMIAVNLVVRSTTMFPGEIPVRHEDFMPGYALDKMLQSEVDDLVRDMPDVTPPVVTEADLVGLPAPVQRYLRASQIIGKPRTLFVRARFQGEFRRTPEERWMKMVCEQYNRIDKPARLWYAAIKFMPFLTFYVRDAYQHGEGNMYARLTPWYRMFDERAPELTQGELLTLLNDMFFFPSAFLSDCIRWEEIDNRSAHVILTTPTLTVSGDVSFNELDEAVNFVAERYGQFDRTYVKTPWSTPFGGYREVNGISIPTEGEAVWLRDTGPFCYVRMSLVDVQSNEYSRYP
jgi:hypothetical protein